MSQSPKCPNCGSSNVVEMADARVEIKIEAIDNFGEDRELGAIAPVQTYDDDRTWCCNDCQAEDEDFSKLL